MPLNVIESAFLFSGFSTWLFSCVVSQAAFFVLWHGQKRHRDHGDAFPIIASIAVTSPIVKLKLVHVFEKFLIEFGLQFLGKTRKQFSGFRLEQSCFL
jgi:hypothetical protein